MSQPNPRHVYMHRYVHVCMCVCVFSIDKEGGCQLNPTYVLYVCKCTYVCMCVCVFSVLIRGKVPADPTYVCMYTILMYACMRACMCFSALKKRGNVPADPTCVCIYTSVYMYVRMYTCMYVCDFCIDREGRHQLNPTYVWCIHTYLCMMSFLPYMYVVYMYLYMYIRIHSYIHTFIRIFCAGKETTYACLAAWFCTHVRYTYIHTLTHTHYIHTYTQAWLAWRNACPGGSEYARRHNSALVSRIWSQSAPYWCVVAAVMDRLSQAY
jgi:hypothetical protein